MLDFITRLIILGAIIIGLSVLVNLLVYIKKDTQQINEVVQDITKMLKEREERKNGK